MVKAEYSDNDNIILTFVDSGEDFYIIMVVEITQDAKILSYKCDTFYSSWENDWVHSNGKATYEYGNANSVDFEVLVDVAKSFPLSE